MNNLPNDNQQNLVSFLRLNKPNPPQPHKDLEQVIMNSLEPQIIKRSFNYRVLIKTVMQAISSNASLRLVTSGFLFVFVSFCFRTPRVAIEPKDLENFVVKNWRDTMHKDSYTAAEEAEAYWLVPAMVESTPNLSISAP